MKRNQRLGLIFFGWYAAVYLAFVLVNALAPEAMEQTPWAGVNWAVISGIGLIVFALILAVVYGVLCDSPAQSGDSERRSRQ